MSDRLAELRRQRALVQEHLAWLDREIANNAPAPASSPPSRSPTMPATIAAPGSSRETASASRVADPILDQYRVAPDALHDDVRKGCFLYFGVAAAILIAVVALLYVAIGSR